MKNVFIIAEAGVNHNGNLANALKLCDVAKKAGVDAIKFQTWKTENIVTSSAKLAAYQENNILDKNDSQFTMLKKLELSFNDFKAIKEYCDLIGLKFLSTPDDEESLDFLLSLNSDIIKIGSGEITNIPYLRKIGSRKVPVILSTGMSNLGETEQAYNTLVEAGAPSVVLLHTTTNYPCPMDEVNLKAMLTLKEAFKCSIGYSDHTEGIEVPVAAVALGAEIIEKHFTIDKSMDGPDHKASLSPVELSQMTIAIRNIEKALGNGVKKPNQSEIEMSKVIKKSIVAQKDIAKGEPFSGENLTVKRASMGIPATYWDLILGKKSSRDYKIDDCILMNDYI